MKIGIVTQYYPPNILGGSQVSIFNIVKGLSIKGHTVQVFTSKTFKNQQDERNYRLKKVYVHRIFSKEYSVGIIRTIYKQTEMKIKTKSFIKKNNLKFDVLYSYGMDTLPTVIHCKKFAKRTAASVNGSWATSPYYHIDYKGREDIKDGFIHFFKDVFMRIFHKNPSGSGGRKWTKIILSPLIYLTYRRRLSFLKRTDRVLPISHKVKNMLLNYGLKEEKLFIAQNLFEKVVPDNNFNLYKRYSISKDKKIFLFSGRIEEIKGIHIILKAIPLVIKKNKNVHFIFVGKEANPIRLRKIIKELRIGNYVTFGGFLSIEELAAAYKQSYMTLYPSIFFDPLPRVPTESFIQGTPVIGTNRGGCEELIVDNVTGFQIKSGDYEELSDKIIKILKYIKIRDKLSKNCLAFANNFLIEIGIKKYLNALI